MKLNSLPGILTLLCAIGFSAVATSCDQPDDSFSETYSFDIHPQSEIFSDTTSRQVTQDSSVIVYSFSIQSGNSMVFEYQRDVIPPETVLDGGLIETLVFQVPSNSDSFEFRDEQLSNTGTFYRRSCFCPLSGAGFKVNDGLIEGEALSANIWFVKADVSVSAHQQTYNLQFESVFRVP